MYKTGQTGCCSSLLAGILSECIVFPVLNALQNGQSVVQFLKRNKCNSHSTCSQTISYTCSECAALCTSGALQNVWGRFGSNLGRICTFYNGYTKHSITTPSCALMTDTDIKHLYTVHSCPAHYTHTTDLPTCSGSSTTSNPLTIWAVTTRKSVVITKLSVV